MSPRKMRGRRFPDGFVNLCSVLTLVELAQLGEDDLDMDLHLARKDDITIQDDILASSPSRKTPSVFGADSSVIGEEVLDPLIAPIGDELIGFGNLPISMSDIVDIDDPKVFHVFCPRKPYWV